MYDTYKNQGLELIGLSIDEDVEAVRSFLKKVEIKYPVVVADLDISEEYGIQFVPHHVFIDRQGKKRAEETGFSEEGKVEFETKVRELLKER